MSTTPDAPRLALIALDLTAGDAEAVEALLTRLAQVTRHRLHTDCGAAVGAVQHVVVEGVTVADYFAAMASLKARDE
ncbi:MAG: hypothetical protein IPQ09_26305 [Myxococcales bacterium]|nr:hypothetical protein [Myxococcales bacterium]